MGSGTEGDTQAHTIGVEIYDQRRGETVIVQMTIEINMPRLAKFFAYRLVKNKSGKSSFMNGILLAKTRDISVRK